MYVSIPCVDPIIYPPVHAGDDVRYPAEAPDGRQWRPPAAPYMDVRGYNPGFGRGCLECLSMTMSCDLVTGWLCEECARKEIKQRFDPFAVFGFWDRFTTHTASMMPTDEYQWYRWYGWIATKQGKPVAPIKVFHALTSAWNETQDLGLILMTSTDHVKHYVGRTFDRAHEESKDALAAGLIPAHNTTISEIEGVYD